jgi:signal transduction histidine kinase
VDVLAAALRDEPEGDPQSSLFALSHDVGQIAAALIAVGEAARLDGGGRWAEIVVGQAEELGRLCAATTEPGASGRFDLLEVVRSVAAPHPDVEVRVHAPDTAITGDRAQVRRAVANVVDNARRVSGEAAIVITVTGTRHGEVRVAVHDSGPGFGAGPAGVAGVGLTIVRSVLQDHGARLEIGRSSMLPGVAVLLAFPQAEAV